MFCVGHRTCAFDFLHYQEITLILYHFALPSSCPTWHCLHSSSNILGFAFSLQHLALHAIKSRNMRERRNCCCYPAYMADVYFFIRYCARDLISVVVFSSATVVYACFIFVFTAPMRSPCIYDGIDAKARDKILSCCVRRKPPG